MNILIVNDDGIYASQLPALVKWAQKYGDVTVVAPKVEQSGKSHAIEFVKPMEIKRVYPFGEAVEAYAMDSTPADCVRFGINGLGRSYDLEAAKKNGASDRSRTGDNHVGNVMLYQLSYTRTFPCNIS